MGRATKQILWLLSIFCVVNSLYAQVFTHKDQAEHFEAVVTQDRLVVRERYRGASTIYGDLSCPLGPAVKATVLPLASDGKLCFTFSQERCSYTRFQNGTAIHKEELANADRPRMCIALTNAQDAQRLATLVNAGPQHSQQTAIAPAAPSVKANASVVTPGPSHATTKTAVVAERPQQPTVAPAAPPVTAKAAAVIPSPSPPRRQAVSTFQDSEADGEKGRWIVSRFMIKAWGNERLSENTYATASIVDEAGAARISGGDRLYIRNESTKYPLYFGLRKTPDEKLEPGQEVTIAVENHRSAGKTRATSQVITLKWFDEAATTRKR